MNRTVVNGMTIEGNHQSVVIKNGRVYIDGKLVTETGSDFCGSIIINGNVEEVNGIKVEINGNVTGDVDGTTITVNGDVLGDVDGTSVKIMGEKKIAKSSDLADSLYNKPKEYNNNYSFDLDEYDDLEKKLNQSIDLLKKKIFETKPELEETYRRADKIDEASKKEQEIEQLDLKDLVKKNKKKKKR